MSDPTNPPVNNPYSANPSAANATAANPYAASIAPAPSPAPAPVARNPIGTVWIARHDAGGPFNAAAGEVLERLAAHIALAIGTPSRP